MPDEKEEQPELKVVDRRRFNADGDPAPGADSRPEPEEAVHLPPREDPAPAPSPPATPSGPGKPRPPRSAGAFERRPASGGGPGLTFEHLVMSLSTSAMLQLGLLEDPEQGPLPANPVAARQTIDLLGVLEEKTRGNLSEGEKGMLEGVLSELRLAYVHVTGGAAAAPPAGG